MGKYEAANLRLSGYPIFKIASKQHSKQDIDPAGDLACGAQVTLVFKVGGAFRPQFQAIFGQLCCVAIGPDSDQL